MLDDTVSYPSPPITDEIFVQVFVRIPKTENLTTGEKRGGNHR